MTAAPFAIEPLGRRDRSGFDCGEPALNRYLETQSGQDVRRRIAACFVALERATDLLAGYYTLSAADIPVDQVDSALTRRLPRYPTIPAARIGRLAVDMRFQGMKLGAALLADAVVRAAASEVAVHAVVVDAKNDAAIDFYRRHGFEPYGQDGRRMIAPLARLMPSMR